MARAGTLLTTPAARRFGAVRRNWGSGEPFHVWRGARSCELVGELTRRWRNSPYQTTGLSIQRWVAEVLAEIVDDRDSTTASSEHGDPLLELFNKLLVITRQAVGETDESSGWISPPQVLQSIHRRGNALAIPQTGLQSPWLFTSGRGDPALLVELRTELAAANRVDIRMSFITWSGVRRLLDVFEAATAIGADGGPGTRFRIITTTYIGATELQTGEKLALLPGVQVRISLDGRRSRLHAKA